MLIPRKNVKEINFENRTKKSNYMLLVEQLFQAALG